MAAKLNKKYFGNRNIGTGGDQTTGPLENSQNYSDDRIGGEGIAAINFPVDAGSFAGNGAVAPITVPAIPAPTLPGGVQATYTVAYEAYLVTTGAGKTGLAVGDTFGHASLPGLVAKVTSTSGSDAVFSCDVAGASRSDSLTLAQIPKDTIGITLTKIAGSGSAGTFLVDVTFHVKSVTITEKGSGYVGTETLPAFTKPGTTSGNVPAGVLEFTTDNGIPYNAGNQENAIIVYADTDDNGSKVGDIIRQVGARRFKVKTADGISTCRLVAAAPGYGEMTIAATDATGGTYYVTKIGARRCTVVQDNGTAFDDDSSVPWTFTSPAPSGYVSIANA